MNNLRPIIGITMGDPAGIGPEIAARALSRKAIYDICRPVIIGDFGIMRQASGIARVKLAVHSLSAIAAAKFEPGTLDVFDRHNANLDRVKHGLISAPAGEAAFPAVKKVIELSMDGQIAATMTGPIHKEALDLMGHHFAGHTEIYAQYTPTTDCVMLLVSDNFRVIHVSTHVPVRHAADFVTRKRVLTAIRLLHRACQQLGVPNPQIGVAAVNPHASDGGLFGHEEETEILPAIAAARELGLQVEGPLSPDILFPKAKGGGFDGCVPMYHDQGHFPFKLDGFSWNRKLGRMASVKGINITLGIPIVRGSVDRGTAFEIAGLGIANADSLIMAVE